ncbi:MAG: hypothetical protein HC813_01975 [Planctomycetes bacterium]|nr:hypothetical protein [Planctomycetota bacterium]
MESETFITRVVQTEFRRFVEIRLHTDHPDPEIKARNKNLQRDRFQTVALPFYAVLTPDGEKVLWTGAGVIPAETFADGLRQAP